jgi:ACS family allantoate permease-like MFS transporter
MSSESSAVKNLEEVEKSSQLQDTYDEKLELDSIDASNGDEALQLVGSQATEHFSEEYNRKLRRKLVILVPCTSAILT